MNDKNQDQLFEKRLATINRYMDWLNAVKELGTRTGEFDKMRELCNQFSVGLQLPYVLIENSIITRDKKAGRFAWIYPGPINENLVYWIKNWNAQYAKDRAKKRQEKIASLIQKQKEKNDYLLDNLPKADGSYPAGVTQASLFKNDFANTSVVVPMLKDITGILYQILLAVRK